MLLTCSVNTSIHDCRFHLLALRCASRDASCVNKAQTVAPVGHAVSSLTKRKLVLQSAPSPDEPVAENDENKNEIQKPKKATPK